MNIDFELLAIISVLTTLTTEAIKKLMDKTSVNYVSNIIATIVSVVLSIVLVIVRPIIMDGVPFTPQLVYSGIVMAFFGALAAMLGWDKLIQTIKQLKG